MSLFVYLPCIICCLCSLQNFEEETLSLRNQTENTESQATTLLQTIAVSYLANLSISYVCLVQKTWLASLNLFMTHF